jgi:L-malate glycosyltransferase
MTAGTPEPVLFLTNAYPDSPSSIRGIFIRRLAGLLKTEGFPVSVVTPKIYSGSPLFEVQEKIRVYRFPFGAGNKRLAEYERIPYCKMVFYFIVGLSFAYYALRSSRCCLVHAHWAIPTGLIGLGLKWMSRKPLVVTLHGSDYRLGMEGGKWLRWLFFLVCKKADHLFCVSERMREGLIEKGINPYKINVLPMGVDDAFFKAGGDRDTRETGRSPIVVSSRNLFPVYNVSLLLRAARIVLRVRPETRFFVAGEGPELDCLKMEVRDLRIEQSVHFLGRVCSSDMPKLVSGADIYVSTSLSDGTSVSLLEALAAGTFPVVTDIAANREWILNGVNGFLVPCEDHVALAHCILDALNDPERLAKARLQNRSLAEEKGSWKRTVAGTAKVYRFLSDSHERRS